LNPEDFVIVVRSPRTQQKEQHNGNLVEKVGKAGCCVM
jgi:hypothetical protein